AVYLEGGAISCSAAKPRRYRGRATGVEIRAFLNTASAPLVPLFLTLATVWILWHSLEKINLGDYVLHSGIRNYRVVALISNHRGVGCDRSESNGQKEPSYRVDFRVELRVARVVQV